ncbi:MAG: hypothetical protein R3255_10515, partial [Candidatus Lokiarchaeia archaeon]|nr:hypothetical protein [Candidatus Lokiarchaeia archaeon]
MEINTNIDGGSIKTCCGFPNIEKSINFLVNSGILKKKEVKEDVYRFSFQEIQFILEPLADNKNYENLIQYYEKKLRRLKDDVQDQIEILLYKAKINPTE